MGKNKEEINVNIPGNLIQAETMKVLLRQTEGKDSKNLDIKLNTGKVDSKTQQLIKIPVTLNDKGAFVIDENGQKTLSQHGIKISNAVGPELKLVGQPDRQPVQEKQVETARTRSATVRDTVSKVAEQAKDVGGKAVEEVTRRRETVSKAVDQAKEAGTKAVDTGKAGLSNLRKRLATLPAKLQKGVEEVANTLKKATEAKSQTRPRSDAMSFPSSEKAKEGPNKGKRGMSI